MTESILTANLEVSRSRLRWFLNPYGASHGCPVLVRQGTFSLKHIKAWHYLYIKPEQVQDFQQNLLQKCLREKKICEQF